MFANTTGNQSASANFSVVITNICGTQATITPSPIGPFSYDFGVDSVIDFTFNDWVCSQVTCGTFVYTFTSASGSLQSFITFDATARRIVITPTNLNQVGTYSY